MPTSNPFLTHGTVESPAKFLPHPKYAPSRFYRIVDIGADNDIADVPIVRITSPTSNSVLTGPITVSVSATCTNLPIITTKLYVDGQEMNPSDNGTDYVVNTPEWPNGPHILYAVATARSGLSGPSGSFPISTSHGVSIYMPVTFSNLITSIAFSQPFFEPSSGQSQQVTAAFAANCNWTLQIQDTDSSNIVRTATGSGGSLVFNWDGTGNGGTNIADGNYSYLISVQTNGLPLPQIQPGTNQPPLPPPPGQSMMSSSTTDGAVNTDTQPTSAKEAFSLGLDYYYPQWPPMPPVRVNGGSELFTTANIGLFMDHGHSGLILITVRAAAVQHKPTSASAPTSGTMAGFACVKSASAVT